MPIEAPSKLLVFVLAVALIFGLVIAANFGFAATEVLPVSRSAEFQRIRERLADAGVVEVSRGYAGFTDRNYYLYVRLTNGDDFELSSPVLTNVRYRITSGTAGRYVGTSPDATTTRQAFMGAIEQDIDRVLEHVAQRRVALESWQAEPAAHRALRP